MGDKTQERGITDKFNAVLFLGSGATAGSGLSKCGAPLPVDSRFFESPIVKDLLRNNYPALRRIREECDFKDENSLYRTWNNLFIYRSFASSDVISSDVISIEDPSEEGQREHYKWQRKIFGKGNQPLTSSQLAELAIWDLRVLVTDVYSNSKEISRKDEKYSTFWKKLKKHVKAVVNLNYDTTFDDTLMAIEEFSCTDVARAPDDLDGRIPIIRPHGSLKWTYFNKRSLGSSWYFPAPWPSCMEETPLESLGYRKSDQPSILEFRQPMIVAPDSIKEEIVGSSSLPGLIDPILRAQWQTMANFLESSNHWIFYGLSLESGDDHLKFLLRHFAKKKEKEWPIIHLSCYLGDSSRLYSPFLENCPATLNVSDYCPERCCSSQACGTITRAKELFGVDSICIHPIPCKHTIDSFLSRQRCALLVS